MNKSLGQSFSELCEILHSYSCEKIDGKFAWEIKCEEIQLLFINMSFLLNSYRPHQARQQIIAILQAQLDRRSESIRELLKLSQIQLDPPPALKRKISESESDTPNKADKMEIIENFQDLYKKYPF